VDSLDEVENNLQNLLSQITEASNKKSEIREQMLALSKELARLQGEADEFDNAIYLKKRTTKELESRRDSLKRQQVIEDEQRRLAEEFAIVSEEFDRLTKEAFWRGSDERAGAFEYQIEGGKRLAQAHRAILGDKRGLGKTLTSVIYMDMVQAKRVLVICINDVAPEFSEEIRHWTNGGRTIIPLYGLPPGQRCYQL
jgi:septal ring factor EnvC (AmiA/AmiB activator)